MEATRRPDGGQGGSVLTMDAVRTMYPADKHFHLLPNVTKTSLNVVPMWGLEVSEIWIDPNDKDQVYPIKGSPDHVGLGKPSLMAIAGAAEASIEALARVGDQSSHRYYEYAAVLSMVQSGGAVRRVMGTCSWSEEREGADKYGPRKAATGAILCALKYLLPIRGKYKGAELKVKSFIVAKWVFTPDLNDPEIRRMVVAAGIQSQQKLYGPTSGSLPSLPSASGLLALPASSVSSIDSGDDTLDMFDGAPATHGAPAAPSPAQVAHARDQTAPPTSEPLPEPLPAAVAAEEPTPEQVVAKMDAATVQPHLDNIWKKYSGRAREEGWIDAMTAAYQRRASALRGGASR